jgi:hypothetical protein
MKQELALPLQDIEAFGILGKWEAWGSLSLSQLRWAIPSDLLWVVLASEIGARLIKHEHAGSACRVTTDGHTYL